MSASATPLSCRRLRRWGSAARRPWRARHLDRRLAGCVRTYTPSGQARVDRLVGLARRVDLKVVADSAQVVEGLSSAMPRAGLSLPVLVECDTGAARCGVATPAEALTLAQAI